MKGKQRLPLHGFWLLLMGLVLFSATSLHGQGPARRAITSDDYFAQADLFGVAYSARFIAYTEGRWQESTDDRKSDLWMVATNGNGAPTRMTSDRAGDRSPQFSPNNEIIYFLGNRKREGEKR